MKRMNDDNLVKTQGKRFKLPCKDRAQLCGYGVMLCGGLWWVAPGVTLLAPREHNYKCWISLYSRLPSDRLRTDMHRSEIGNEYSDKILFSL